MVTTSMGVLVQARLVKPTMSLLSIQKCYHYTYTITIRVIQLIIEVKQKTVKFNILFTLSKLMMTS